MSNYYIGVPTEGYVLYHHGVKGMKWGVRKQRTLIGKQRGASNNGLSAEQKAIRRAKVKKYAKVGAIAIGAVLVAYGSKKIHDKKLIEAANNYASMYSSKVRFRTTADVRENWYGNRRAMYRDLQGYTNRSIERSQARAAKYDKAEKLRAAQNEYLKNRISGAAKRNKLRI